MRKRSKPPKLMESVKAKHDEVQVVETMDLFSLSQEVITQFIADSISKEEEVEQEGAAEEEQEAEAHGTCHG